MFSEQTAPSGTYDKPINSKFHADGCMKHKNGYRALTGCSLVYNNSAKNYISHLVAPLLLWSKGFSRYCQIFQDAILACLEKSEI